MALTSLQWAQVRRRQQGRRHAWMDGRAFDVGHYDAQLHSSQCPYAKDSRAAADWRAGYDAAKAERAERDVRDEAVLVSVISSMRSRLSK